MSFEHIQIQMETNLYKLLIATELHDGALHQVASLSLNKNKNDPNKSW